MKQVEIENIGGIGELTYSFDEDMLLVSGPNATNKTSFLEAISFALSRPQVSIKSGKDLARVKLDVNGRSVERYAERTPNGVRIDGEGFLEEGADESLVENFACILEMNPLRQAVRQGGDIESILKEPVDLVDLERQQQEKIDRKRSVRQRIDELSEVESELESCEASLEESRDRAKTLEDELESLRAEYADTSTEDDTVEQLREERASLISKRDRYERQVSEIEDAIERLKSQKHELKDELEEAKAMVDETNPEELKHERNELQGELADLEERLDVLQSVYTANREMLSDEYTGVLGKESGLMGDTVTCWACGNTAEPEEFEETLDELQSLISRDRKAKREFEPRLQELSEEIQAARDAESRVRQIESSLQDIDRKLDNRRGSLETKREQQAEVEAEIDSYSERISDAEDESNSQASALAAEIEETRLDLHTVESTVEQLEEQRSTLETRLDERAALEDELEALTEEITALTSRIEGLEETLRTSFNDAMDELLDALEFDSIERVWLTGDFELLIAREVDGKTRRDSIENLSESEREMIGLVLALSGFLTYDVAEKVPILVLDALGAFDAMRTERLLQFFADKTEVLIASTLPEVSVDLPYDRMVPGART